MKQQMQLVQNEEFGKLEILMIEGKPYFPATECAKILGHTNPQRAIREFCKGVTETVTPSAGGHQKAKYIPEGDLYRLIIRSRIPAAQRFESWVFDEVLPSIRAHGAYITPDTVMKMLHDPSFTGQLLFSLRDEKDKNAILQSEIDALTPKARYCDRILNCKSSLQASVIAKDYGMTTVAFNRLLHDLDIQYKIGSTWLLYKEYADQGYTKSYTYHVGGDAVVHTHWTQKGRLFLYEKLKHNGIIPLMEYMDTGEEGAYQQLSELGRR